MYTDELDVIFACIKSQPHYFQTIIDKLEKLAGMLGWIFGLICVLIITIILVSL